MIGRGLSRREVVWLLGVILLAGGLVVTFAPGVLPVGVREFAESVESSVEPWVGVLVLSVVVFLYAVARFIGSRPDAVERLVDDDDASASVPDFEDAVSFDPERPGREFDYEIARTVRLLDRDPNADAWRASGIREDLRSAVVAVHGDRERAAVEAAIEDGSWTDDRVAAAFLGGERAPDVAIWRRLYAWFYPARAFENRVEHVVDAIERAADDEGLVGGLSVDADNATGHVESERDGDGPGTRTGADRDAATGGGS